MSYPFLTPSGGGLGKPPANSVEKDMVRMALPFLFTIPILKKLLVKEEMKNSGVFCYTPIRDIRKSDLIVLQPAAVPQ
jgi:hypothetical protein